jgi:CSLREA domain-containing protein
VNRLSGDSTIYVTSLSDSSIQDGYVTLREAIQAANQNTHVGDAPAGIATADTIGFAVQGTVELNGALPTITSGMTIAGTVGAPTSVILDGNYNDSIFRIEGNVHLGPSGLHRFRTDVRGQRRINVIRHHLLRALHRLVATHQPVAAARAARQFPTHDVNNFS